MIERTEFDNVTLQAGDTEIPVIDLSIERFNITEAQGSDAMAADSRNRTAEDSRVQKARRIEVQDVFEPRDGIYVVDFINENGEERTRVLIPSKLFSDNPDVIYRSNEGIIGKYTLAAAREHDGVRADLALALEDRQEDLDEQIQEAREQVEEAAEQFNNIETARRALQGDL